MAVQKRSQIAFRNARQTGRAEIFDNFVCGSRERTFEAARCRDPKQFARGFYIPVRTPVEKSLVDTLTGLCTRAIFAAGDCLCGLFIGFATQFFFSRLKERTGVWRRLG